jgi:hypothetical protein
MTPTTFDLSGDRYVDSDTLWLNGSWWTFEDDEERAKLIVALGGVPVGRSTEREVDGIGHLVHSGEPGKDGTPAWAYDEDGYCVCCGNGRWKFHTPDCALRDALDLVRIGAVIESTVEDGRGSEFQVLEVDVDDGVPEPAPGTALYARRAP